MRDFMIEHELATLGKTIRQLRKGRNLSQEAFADLCDLHRTYICDVERGARNVTVGTLVRIAHALGTTVSELTRNLENVPFQPEKSHAKEYMNSTKLLIGIAVLFLAALPAQAQSVLEDLIFETAIANSILEDQGGPDVLETGAPLDSNASINGDTTGDTQASTAPGTGQIGQFEFTSTYSNNEPNGTEIDANSFPNVAGTQNHLRSCSWTSMPRKVFSLNPDSVFL